MDRFDFSPLFRSTIGFDRLTRLVDAASRVDNAALAYPPYNIEKTGEDAYRLTMAVAGFSPDEVDVTRFERRVRDGIRALDDLTNELSAADYERAATRATMNSAARV